MASYLASPVRTQRPCAADSAGSPIASLRQTSALRIRAQPPASPCRQPTTPPRPNNNVPASSNDKPRFRDRGVPAPASYTFRQSAPDAHRTREEEEGHASTQLILLLTLSVVLLTLPWVVDHPVTLLVPVALLMLPITSGAFRSIVAEGFSLVASGLQWFWRHRHIEAQAKASSGHGAPQQRQPQQAPVSGLGYQVPGPWHGAVHRPDLRRGSPQQQPHPVMRSVDHPGQYMARSSASSMGEWHPTGPQPRHAPSYHSVDDPRVPPAACHLPATSLELTTPDLDFDSESDVDAGGPEVPTPYIVLQHQQFADSAWRYRPVTPNEPACRHPESVDQQECTVRNWDDAECNQRRGHKPLSELLNNGL